MGELARERSAELSVVDVAEVRQRAGICSAELGALRSQPLRHINSGSARSSRRDTLPWLPVSPWAVE